MFIKIREWDGRLVGRLLETVCNVGVSLQVPKDIKWGFCNPSALCAWMYCVPIIFIQQPLYADSSDDHLWWQWHFQGANALFDSFSSETETIPKIWMLSEDHEFLFSLTLALEKFDQLQVINRRSFWKYTSFQSRNFSVFCSLFKERIL